MSKRGSENKFSESAQLFKFCFRVLSDQRGERINDQDVGNILDYNPSDCSHWKRGEKQVKSIFAFEKLAKAIHVDVSILQDLSRGIVNLDEAYFEHQEAAAMRDMPKKMQSLPLESSIRGKVDQLLNELFDKSQFAQAPLYLPEILRLFPHIQLQPADMMDRVSRVLRTKPGHYTIQHQKGQMRAQTRMSIAKELARILFEGERAKYSFLGPLDSDASAMEQALFVINFLIPRKALLQEVSKIEPKKNLVSELATIFWVPKSLMAFQLKDLILSGKKSARLQKSSVADAHA